MENQNTDIETVDNEVKSFREIQAELLKPIPYKFRLQSIKYGKATVVSYIDSRQLQDRLDEVVGAENWQVKYEEIKGNLFASIGLLTSNGWVWKSDCGTESNVEKEKGEASDSFKRAGVMWGVGRFLYSLPIISLKTGKYTPKNGGKEKEYPATEDGKLLWTSEDLNNYCKELVSKPVSDKSDAAPTEQKPAAKAPAAKQDLYPGIKDKWDEAVKYIKNYDSQTVSDALDTIKKKYNLSADNEAQLLEEAKGIKNAAIEIPQETIDAIKAASTSEELTSLWNDCEALWVSKEFIEIWNARRKEVLIPAKGKKAA